MSSSGERSWGTSSSSHDQRVLLESAERLAQSGSWQWTPETGELHWSDNLFRLFGMEPGSVIPTILFLMEMTHPDDREHVGQELERVMEWPRHQRFDYRIIRPDGAIRHLRLTLAEVHEDGKPTVVLGTVQDLTDQRRAEREIAAHVAVSEALAEWESFEGGAETLLRKLAGAMDCAAGALWVPDDDVLVANVFWCATTLDNADEFEAATRQLRLLRGAALPAQVWQTGVPVALNVCDQPGFLRVAEAEAAGLRGAVAFPALAGEEVMAVVELYSAEDSVLSERLMRSLVGMGHELGQFLGHHRGELGPPVLTPRELEVLRLAAQGNPKPQIAELLTISPATVKTHLEHVYAKLEVSDRAAAVATALRDGLID
ncbi:MAG: LuxR C-terminal-related transcriptional regulator [Solirubrobacterales bacterium]